jgi:hypothetical protein
LRYFASYPGYQTSVNEDRVEMHIYRTFVRGTVSALEARPHPEKQTCHDDALHIYGQDVADHAER